MKNGRKTIVNRDRREATGWVRARLADPPKSMWKSSKTKSELK
jgi:hypothetical protein